MFGKVTNEVGERPKGRQARGGRGSTKMQMMKRECGQLGVNDGENISVKEPLYFQRNETFQMKKDQVLIFQVGTC